MTKPTGKPVGRPRLDIDDAICPENLLDQRQKTKLKDWLSKKKKTSTTIGGRYTYKFTPTGLGLMIEVIDNFDKDTLDLTEIDNW